MFKLFDIKQKGSVGLDSFLRNLGILCRGTIDERNNFLFKLHDLSDEGKIPKENMYTLFRSLPPTLLIVMWRRIFGTKLPDEVGVENKNDDISKEYDDNYITTLVDDAYEKVDINNVFFFR